MRIFLLVALAALGAAVTSLDQRVAATTVINTISPSSSGSCIPNCDISGTATPKHLWLRYNTTNIAGLMSYAGLRFNVTAGGTSGTVELQISVQEESWDTQPTFTYATAPTTFVSVTTWTVAASGYPLQYEIDVSPYFKMLKRGRATLTFRLLVQSAVTFTLSNADGAYDLKLNLVGTNNPPSTEVATAISLSEDSSYSADSAGSYTNEAFSLLTTNYPFAYLDTDFERYITWVIISPPSRGTLVTAPTGSAGLPTVTYTPTANYNGTDTFSIAVTDILDQERSVPKVVTVTVNPVNDPPVISAFSFSTNEDTNRTGSISVTDIDSNIWEMVCSVASAPSSGVVSFSSFPLQYTYAPSLNFNGNDLFSYTCFDGTDYAIPRVVSVTVNSVNDAPVARPVAASTLEDNLIIIDLSESASDVDNALGSLVFSVVAPPTRGNAQILGSLLQYTPLANDNLGDVFTYRVYDGALYSATVQVNITIQPVNDAPTANAATFNLLEDNSVSGTLTGSDIDSPLSSFVFRSDASGLNGTLVLNETTGAFTYTPPPNYNGLTSFRFTIGDGSGGFSAAATITLNVTAVNDLPVPVSTAYAFSVYEDVSTIITVAATDIDNQFLQYSFSPCPECAFTFVRTCVGPTAVTCTNGMTPGQIEVLSRANASSLLPGAFTWSAVDVYGGSTGPVTATIVVLPVNDAPWGNPVSASGPEDGSASGTLSGTDIDSTVLFFRLELSGGTQTALGGTITSFDNSTGAFTYVPAPNFNGQDSFLFTVIDDGGLSSQAVAATITITPVNDSPVAVNGSASTLEDTQFSGSLVSLCTDIDLPPQTLVFSRGGIENQRGGTVAVAANGSFVFTPTPDFSGAGSFVFQCSDGLDSASSWFALTIIAVDDAPVASGASFTLNEDSAITDSLTATDIDSPSAGFIFQLRRGVASGTLNLEPVAGTFTYTPSPNFFGPDSFTFQVNSSGLISNVATVSLSVTGVPDAPVAAPASFAGTEDTPLTQFLDAQNLVTDVDGDTVFTYYFVASSAVGGSVTVFPNGTFVFVPDANYNGPAEFQFVVNDGLLNSAASTASINIFPVDDPPTAIDGAVTTIEDATVSVGTTLSASDIDDAIASYLVLTPPAHSSSFGVNPSTGLFFYIPEPDFSGADSFTFSVFDAAGAYSNIATQTINVTPVNDPPYIVISSDSILAVQRVTTTRSLVPYFADIDSPVLSYEATGADGILINQTAGTFSFAPLSGGIIVLQFRASDGEYTTGWISITVTATAVPEPPMVLAPPAAWVATEDVPFSGYINATDPDTPLSDLRFTAVQQPASGGSVVVNSVTGAFVYTGGLNFNGEDTFLVAVTDGISFSPPLLMQVTVLPVDDPPVATPGAALAIEKIPTFITLSQRVSDVDSTQFNFSIVAGAGSASLINSGAEWTVVYVSLAFDDPGFALSDLVTFTVTDGVSTATSFVNISIILGLHPPVANGTLLFSGPEDASWTGTAAAAQVTSTSIVFTLGARPQFGTLTSFNNATGAFTYQPRPDFFGLDSLSFQIVDGPLFSSLATIQLNVMPVNDPPAVYSLNITATQNEPAPGRLSATDVDRDPLRYEIISEPTQGVVQLDAETGDFIYTPAPLALGADSFTFNVKDTSNSPAPTPATVFITIYPVAAFFSCSSSSTIGRDPSLAGQDGVIDGRLVCDGFPDCPDLSDEAGSPTCRLSLVRVQNGVLIVTLVLIGLTLVLAGLVWKNRNDFVMKAASPIFLGHILLGGVLGYVSLLTWMPYPTNSVCLARAWIPNLAFMFIFGALFIKTYRVWRLFGTADGAQRVVLNDRELLTRLYILIAVDVTLLIIWSASDPLRPQLTTAPGVGGSAQHTECRSDSASAFLAIFLAIKFSMMLVGGFLGFKTRRVGEKFKESRYIAIIVLSWLLLSLIILPLLFTSQTNPQTQFIYLTIGILSLVTVTLALLFFPKFAVIYGGPDDADDSMWKSQRDVGASLPAGAAAGPNARVSQDPLL